MKRYKVTCDLNDSDPPKEHERRAAKILATYFRSDLIFIKKRINGSPDLKVKKTGQVWELKSPTGNGKRTFANNLREASHQSRNVIMDLSRCKMNNTNAISKIRGFMNSGDAHIDKLLIIDKKERVLDFFKDVV